MGEIINLNILHAVLSLDCGGLERLVLYLCREGVAAGDKVTVLCLDQPGKLADEVRKTGVEVITLHRKPGLMSLPEAKRLRAIIKQINPDVVHCHQMGAALYAGTIARTLRISAVIHTEHGNHDYSSWRHKLLACIAFSTARKIYCVSRDIADNLTTSRVVTRKQLSVQVNGIPLPAAGSTRPDTALGKKLGIDERATVYGSVGRLVKIKRQERLLNAVATLADRNRKVYLIFVGDGPQYDELKELAADRGISHLVHFSGYQTDPLPYLTLMDVFVLTSDSEGMPMALLEAWATARPVVVTAVGGLPELVTEDENGLLLPPGDQQRLVDALEALANDPDRRKRLGENGRSLVATRYSADRTARAYRAAYMELVSG